MLATKKQESGRERRNEKVVNAGGTRKNEVDRHWEKELRFLEYRQIQILFYPQIMILSLGGVEDGEKKAKKRG